MFFYRHLNPANPVQEAFALKYRADPKLINELLTGDCFWQGEWNRDEERLEAMLDEAEELSRDAADAATLFPGYSVKADQYRAAAIALGRMADAIEPEEDAAPYRGRGPYLQSEFI